MLFTLAMIAAKFLIWFLRFTGSGGTTLPGRLAAKIYPGILLRLSGKLNVILITGTNGKTTTGRIISRILEINDIPHLQNRSGANLKSGITTAFIEAASIRGNFSCIMAVIESDEAAFKTVAPLLSPKVIVVTNFFRDQLDRYGELLTTVQNVKTGISQCPNAVLVLNADDSLSSYIGREVPNKVIYYGIDGYNSSRSSADIAGADASNCIYCTEKYQYSARTYGHLGHFFCPGCGFKRPEASVACIGVNRLSLSGSDVALRFDEYEVNNSHSVQINLPGLYNVYNALAASACAKALGVPTGTIIDALGTFECGFGRMEIIEHEGRHIRLILIKNPTGFNQVIDYLFSEKKKMVIAFFINDNDADGTDISWLWDVDIELFRDLRNLVVRFYCGGIRAEDMAVRLKYAGIDPGLIFIEKNMKTIIEDSIRLLSEDETLFVLPTYTAMLEVRKLLGTEFNLKEFWK